MSPGEKALREELGAEAVVIARTEPSVVARQPRLSIKAYDPDQILADAIVAAAAGGVDGPDTAVAAAVTPAWNEP